MASYTTNLNLKKPAGSENVAIGDINNNMDAIDAAYGTLNSNIKYHYAAFSPTLPSNVTGQGANPTQYFYSSSVVSVKISFKITDVTQTGYPGRVEIPHNIPASYVPPYEIQFAGGNGEGNGITPGVINSTNIIIYPMKTGTTYCQATITYIPSLI